MTFEVIVTNKKEVLDPQARTIQHELERQGYESLEGLRMARHFIFDFKEGTENPEELAEKMAREILSNPCSESYVVKRLS